MEKVTGKSAVDQVLKNWNLKYDFSVRDVAEAVYLAGLEEAARAVRYHKRNTGRFARLCYELEKAIRAIAQQKVENNV